MTDPVAFATRADLMAWLDAHAGTESELWVRMHRKATGTPSVTWEDCVTAALCHGWIDGVRRGESETTSLQRLTPRRKGSGWSQRNRDHVARLIAAGEMRPAGLAEVEAARADGRWDAAYAGQADMVIPADFLAALEGRAVAAETFGRLKRSELFRIYYQLHTAKTEKTRAARMGRLLAILDEGKAP
jgi:uncharacterized protein YdeI (YjbR/CyaY-like superfamily)